jgi:transcriptional regulator with XRE-family HTH domain
MARGKPVAITPSVLEWALNDSGVEPDELAQAIGVAPSTLRAWLAEREQPTLTALRALAAALKRPLATFLLPRPPQLPRPAVEFRARPGRGRAKLNPAERRRIREAARLQRMLAWTTREIGQPAPVLPRVSISASRRSAQKPRAPRHDVAAAGTVALRVGRSARVAGRVERSGVFVLMLPMGGVRPRSSRCGTSSSAHRPQHGLERRGGLHPIPQVRPLVDQDEFRVPRRRVPSADREIGPDGRWCEEFAASVILPRQSLGPTSPATALRCRCGHRYSGADRPALSARACARPRCGSSASGGQLGLYKALPPLADRKQAGGGGGGRSRTQIRHDQ